jgi:hypothetical protein
MSDKNPTENKERAWFIVSETSEEEFLAQPPAGPGTPAKVEVESPRDAQHQWQVAGVPCETPAYELPPTQVEVEKIKIEFPPEPAETRPQAEPGQAGPVPQMTQAAGSVSNVAVTEPPATQVERIQIRLEPESPAFESLPGRARALEEELETTSTLPAGAPQQDITNELVPGIMVENQSALVPALAHPVGFSRTEVMRTGGNAPTTPVNVAGFLVIVKTPQPVRLGQITPLKAPRTAIGRASGLGCFLDDPSVAEIHAVITHQREQGSTGFFLHAPATAPVYINGASTHKPTRLTSNDRIMAGRSELAFFEVAIEGGAN